METPRDCGNFSWCQYWHSAMFFESKVQKQTWFLDILILVRLKTHYMGLSIDANIGTGRCFWIKLKNIFWNIVIVVWQNPWWNFSLCHIGTSRCFVESKLKTTYFGHIGVISGLEKLAVIPALSWCNIGQCDVFRNQVKNNMILEYWVYCVRKNSRDWNFVNWCNCTMRFLSKFSETYFGILCIGC